jgi:carbamoyl-phosphate synthase large subunit
MGIGRSFTEAFLKAMRSRELDAGAATPWQTLADVPDDVHAFFLDEILTVQESLIGIETLEGIDAEEWIRLKRLGLSDLDIAEAAGATEVEARAARLAYGIRPAYRRVDSCAGEVEAASNYYYSSWGEADEAPPSPNARKVVILGSGPNRIGQGIEFDYCCVHATQSFRRLGYEAVMVNCNPETVSTDYDTSDRLYFEPLDAESVLSILEREQPEGVVIQFGGQTPLKLARAIEEAGFRVLGTPFDAIDLAEDRERFGALLSSLEIRCPDWRIVGGEYREAQAAADEIGYPVLIRPSYVLGGRAMRICYGPDDVRDALERQLFKRVLVDRFIEHAIEIDVDAVCDGESVYIGAVMEHVEEAGVHSGDSSCVLPAPSLTADVQRAIERVVRRLGRALGVVGLLNVQLAVADGEVYVLEANPRASRTVPFASKATGVNLVDAACRVAAGETIEELGLPPERHPRQFSVKAAVLPFARFPGSDPVLGPEMRSTGEVMATADDLPTALAKAERAAGRPLPTAGAVFLSVREADKRAVVPIAAALAGLGFDLVATRGTATTLRAAGLEVEEVAKVSETEEHNIVERIRRGACDLVVNTPGGAGARTDGYLIREATLRARVPCITTISGAAAAVHAIGNARAEAALSLQERIDAETSRTA